MMKRFSIVQNGYDIDEVNRFIDLVINRLEKLNAENAKYETKVRQLMDEIKNKPTDVSKLEHVLIAAEQTSKEIRDVAKEEARIIVEEAKNNANSIVHEALIKSEKVEHERLLLEKNIRVYKERMKSLVESQLLLIDEIDKIKM